MTDAISAEDYIEPCCPFTKPNAHVRIPTDRVIEKLDFFLHKNDYSGAERHLLYWLSESENEKDFRGRLTVLNELIGLYRKLSEKEKALSVIQKAFETLDILFSHDSISKGTTLINIATALKSFDMAKDALPLYEEAKRIYESNLSAEDERLGGLYNNMALALMALSEYKEAEEMFYKALSIMEKVKNGKGEMAITYLNLADLVNAQKGPEDGENEICALLEKAESLLLRSDIPQDGNYAFICEKCAPVFGYYGFFLVEQELSERAAKLYERN